MADFGSEKTPRNIVIGVMSILTIMIILSWLENRKK